MTVVYRNRRRKPVRCANCWHEIKSGSPAYPVQRTDLGSKYYWVLYVCRECRKRGVVKI